MTYCDDAVSREDDPAERSSAGNAEDSTDQALRPEHSAARVFADGKRDIDILDLYLRDLSEITVLSPEEESSLAARAAQGDPDAFKRMVEANTPLVVTIAKKYRNRGVPFLDLIEAGNLALFDAVKYYDPARGNKFSSYAYPSIHRSISRELTRFTSSVSLNSPLADAEDGAEIGDLIGDAVQEDPLDAVIRSSMQTDVKAALNCLPAQEKQVIELRYGMYDRHVHTYAEIERMLELKKGAAARIEERALKKLRHPSVRRLLISYSLESAYSQQEEVVSRPKRSKRGTKKDQQEPEPGS